MVNMATDRKLIANASAGHPFPCLFGVRRSSRSTSHSAMPISSCEPLTSHRLLSHQCEWIAPAVNGKEHSDNLDNRDLQSIREVNLVLEVQIATSVVLRHPPRL